MKRERGFTINHKAAYESRKAMLEQRKQALKAFREVHDFVTFITDDTEINLLCGRLELKYDKDHKLQLIIDGIDLAGEVTDCQVNFIPGNPPDIKFHFNENLVKVNYDGPEIQPKEE